MEDSWEGYQQSEAEKLERVFMFLLALTISFELYDCSLLMEN